MERGRNWSGNERNVAFLNTGDGKFAGVSALLGFDSPADGRGMVLVDWDGDGDQDVWLTQRTAPRLRFLRNDNHSNGNAIQIKLTTPSGTSQAIGARVTLTDSHGAQQIRTLPRACILELGHPRPPGSSMFAGLMEAQIK